MVQTKKRIALSLSKADIEIIESLKKILGENMTEIYRRALLAYSLHVHRTMTKDSDL